MNNQQTDTLNRLKEKVSHNGLRSVTVAKADIQDDILYFIIKTNFVKNPTVLDNKSIIGFIGKRGKLTITFEG